MEVNITEKMKDENPEKKIVDIFEKMHYNNLIFNGESIKKMDTGKIYKKKVFKNDVKYFVCCGKECKAMLKISENSVEFYKKHSNKCNHEHDIITREEISVIEMIHEIDGRKKVKDNMKKQIYDIFFTKFFTKDKYSKKQLEYFKELINNTIYEDSLYQIMIQRNKDDIIGVCIFCVYDSFIYLYLICSIGMNGGTKILIEMKNLSLKENKPIFLESISQDLDNYYIKNGFKIANMNFELFFKEKRIREINTSLMIYIK
jgi:hypothetical protein